MDTLVESIEKFAMPVVFGIIGLLAIIFIVWPIVRMFSSSEKPQPIKTKPITGIGNSSVDMAKLLENPEIRKRLSAVVDDNRHMTDREKIQHLAQSDPDKVVELIKAWLHEGK